MAHQELLVGTRKGLFQLRKNTSTGKWEIHRTSFIGDPVVLMLPGTEDGEIFAAMDLGHFGPKVRKSQDSGTSWSDLATPEYPPKPEGLEDLDGMGREVEWKVQTIWALAHGYKNKGELWLGTIPGGLFYSADSGQSWTLNRPLWEHPKRHAWMGGGADAPGIHSICIHKDQPNRIVVGVSCGGAWVSEDAGDTWQNQSKGMRAAYLPEEQAYEPWTQDPHCIVQSPSTPSTYWAQHHNGIFRSTDHSASWEEIKDVSPSVFGFPAVVHPNDDQTAWFVPAVKDECRVPVDGKLVVTRTRDGGKSFETLTDGLPQEHAYDIVYRHAFDIDATGETLAFGSTTGALFISENQGDSWQEISAHLPPVYAVRFGQLTS